MIPKRKRVRLHGKALRSLVDEVYERDNHRCVNCGRWVQDGEKPHHEPPGYGRKSDEIEHMVLLCYECHNQRHGGRKSTEVQQKCIDRLARLYGG